MSIALLPVAAFLLAAEAPPPLPEPEEIVVVATKWKCQLRYARRQLSARAIDRLADGWPADRPVRLVVPSGADLQCLYRLTTQLSRDGTRVVEFVEPKADAAEPDPPPAP